MPRERIDVDASTNPFVRAAQQYMSGKQKSQISSSKLKELNKLYEQRDSSDEGHLHSKQ